MQPKQQSPMLAVVSFLYLFQSQTTAFTSLQVQRKVESTFHSGIPQISPLTAVSVDRDRGKSIYSRPQNRFDRTASNEQESATECVLTIDGIRYNVTAWAKAHPGGDNILKKFNGKDASKAFHAGTHSSKAYNMLARFAVEKTNKKVTKEMTTKGTFSRLRQKLFTKEDPIGVHKYLGIFALLHFVYRYGQMYFGDPSAGFGSRMGKGPGTAAAFCLLPHAFLSLSSLIFHTVPRERVTGRPMIWKEYRVHNIVFGLRSVVSSFLAWLAYYNGNKPIWRKIAVVGSCLSVLLANWAADVGTARLRANNLESTTATMPYWEGCAIRTQRRFKTFYAYCQFMATLACMAVGNPVWGFSVLIAIQMASLLMTLVRKGIISARGYHIGYTITLVMPWFVGLRNTFIMKTPDFFLVVGLAAVLYRLRREGVNKYVLWVPICVARTLYGDQVINWSIW